MTTCRSFWGVSASPYSDTPTPKCFGTVSPLDPQLFSTIVEHAGDLLAGRANPKYSPIEVAQWLEDYTAASGQALASARLQATSHTSPEFRRIEEDVLIQNGLGRFFAAKLRSGVLFEIYYQDRECGGRQACAGQIPESTRAPGQAWRRGPIASTMQTLLMADIPMRRGNWSDTVGRIDKDIAAMESKLQTPPASGSAQNVERAIQAATGKPNRPSRPLRSHAALRAFIPGNRSRFLCRPRRSDAPNAVQSLLPSCESGRTLVVGGNAIAATSGYSAAIPGDYTNSVYPLQYYFVLQRGADAAWLYPGVQRHSFQSALLRDC